MSNDIENMIRKILVDMQNGTSSNVETRNNVESEPSQTTITTADYPIAKKHPEWITLPNGESLDYVTLDNVLSGKVQMKDLRIKPSTLKAQGDIAKAGGRKQIKLNFSRAAEMTKVDDKRLLEMYNALRPYRSTKQELFDIADELENKYGAIICANYVREAAENYEKRKKLKGDN